jgi:hypothetical protein
MRSKLVHTQPMEIRPDCLLAEANCPLAAGCHVLRRLLALRPPFKKFRFLSTGA